MTQNTLKRNGNIINKKYLEYFLPTVLTAMANNIAIMVDSVLVGQMVGSVAMAAINLLSPITQLYFSLVWERQQSSHIQKEKTIKQPPIKRLRQL